MSPLLLIVLLAITILTPVAYIVRHYIVTSRAPHTITVQVPTAEGPKRATLDPNNLDSATEFFDVLDIAARTNGKMNTTGLVAHAPHG